jgi:hypothetical protein
MAIPRPPASVPRSNRRITAWLFAGNSLAVCTLFVANAVAASSIVGRVADFPVGHGNIGIANGLGNTDASSGNGNTGSFNGNGNSGSFNGNGNTGNFNGNGNAGSFNGNGNAGNFNGNANCGNGIGNGFSSDGNGNGKGDGGPPAWCQILKNLSGELGLPPGVIPDFTLK